MLILYWSFIMFIRLNYHGIHCILFFDNYYIIMSQVTVTQLKHCNLHLCFSSFCWRWTGEMLGDIMLLCLYGEKFDRAFEILNKLAKDQNSIVGVPNIESLKLFTDMCISQNKLNEAIVSLTSTCCYVLVMHVVLEDRKSCAVFIVSFLVFTSIIS